MKLTFTEEQIANELHKFILKRMTFLWRANLSQERAKIILLQA